MTRSPAPFDYVLVGGGLGSALLALALFARRPSARVALLERSDRLGGDHTWCFHRGDVSDAARALIEPLVVANWPRQEVLFPELDRVLEEPYAAVTSERLHEVVSAAFASRPHCELRLGSAVASATAHDVRLDDGEVLRADAVFDARGPGALRGFAGGGYQKFLGLELSLRAPAPLTHPRLMDARVPQQDGFRFLYCLPFEPRRVLLEDTYFSDSAELDVPALRGEILEYAEREGYWVDRVLREEVGVLPLPSAFARGEARAREAITPEGAYAAGYAGGWFHPVTGYSFPIAARVAEAVASCDARTLRERVWPALVREQRAQLRFALLLNRLFFDAFAPEQRRNVIERFYRLPPATVQRFYALSLTAGDRAKILCGRPPRGFSIARVLTGGSSR